MHTHTHDTHHALSNVAEGILPKAPNPTLTARSSVDVEGRRRRRKRRRRRRQEIKGDINVIDSTVTILVLSLAVFIISQQLLLSYKLKHAVHIPDRFLHYQGEWLGQGLKECTHICVCVRMCVRMCVCMCVCMCMCMYMCMCVHACMQACMYACMYACMCACVRACMCSCVCAY